MVRTSVDCRQGDIKIPSAEHGDVDEGPYRRSALRRLSSAASGFSFHDKSTQTCPNGAAARRCPHCQSRPTEPHRRRRGDAVIVIARYPDIRMALLTPAGLRVSALDALAAQPNVDRHRLAAIGFYQGKIIAAELARAGAPILCAIGFHSDLSGPAGSVDQPIDAKVLRMIGERDPVAPQADRATFAAEMDAKGADWRLRLSGGVGHTHTNPRVDALREPGSITMPKLSVVPGRWRFPCLVRPSNRSRKRMRCTADVKIFK